MQYSGAVQNVQSDLSDTVRTSYFRHDAVIAYDETTVYVLQLQNLRFETLADEQLRVVRCVKSSPHRVLKGAFDDVGIIVYEHLIVLKSNDNRLRRHTV